MARCVAFLAVVVAAARADAALVLEFIEVSSITAGPSSGPALSALTPTPGQFIFLQVAIRDTLGSGPEYGQPGTLPWRTNGGLAGPGSLGLGVFFLRFDGIPGVAVNPAPTNLTNVRLVDHLTYASVFPGSNPPTFTRFGGLINFGFEPGAVPDPVTHRIALGNLRIEFLGVGSGAFILRDPHPTSNSIDNAVLLDSDIGATPNAGSFQSIDDLLFGGSFTNTYGLPIMTIPEPSGLALAGFVAAVIGWRRRRCGSSTSR